MRAGGVGRQRAANRLAGRRVPDPRLIAAGGQEPLIWAEDNAPRDVGSLLPRVADGQFPVLLLLGERLDIASLASLVGYSSTPSTASRRARTGEVDITLTLSAASWRDRAMACCRIALLRSRDSHETDNNGERGQQGHHRYRPFSEVHRTSVLPQMLTHELVQALAPEGGCHRSNIIGRHTGLPLSSRTLLRSTQCGSS